MHRSNPTRIARRFLATTPTGRPSPVSANLAATDSNLARQPPAGYGGAPGPIPQAGPGMHRGGAPPPPPPPPPKGGSSMPLLLGIGALAAGGAYYYLTQTSDGSVHIKSNAEKLQDRAEDKFDSLKERAAAEASSLKHRAENLADKAESRYLDPAKREAGRFVDKLQSPDDKYGAEQVKDAAQGSRSPFAALNPTNLGDKLKREAKDVAGDARDEARSWGDALRSGPSEHKAWKPTVDEIKRYRDMLRSPDRKFGYDQVADAFRNHGVETATVASRNPWFDWMGPGHDLHLRSAERQLDTWEREGKSAIDNAASAVKSSYRDAKAETKSWLNWGAQKAENAADAAETELERTKRAAEREASSWSNWASRKTDEAKSAVADATSSAEASAKSAYNDAASAAEQAKRDTEREAKSWWNWSGEKAHEGKETLKDGLLAAERGVEHGAQKAQYETKKL